MVTRSGANELQGKLRGELAEEAKKADVHCVGSLGDAVKLVRGQEEEGKTFIIGGAEIYRAALHEDYRGAFTHLRILQTEVQRKDEEGLEIDTFFPVDVRKDKDWRQATGGEVAEWVGEDLPQVKSGNQEWKEDGDFKIRTLGWEKELSSS